MVDDLDLGMRHPLHGQPCTQAGAHVKAVPPDVMNYLVRVGCFTPAALLYLNE